MAEQTGIEWCDATFNPWWGCEKVSPGCAHCYADTLATRYAPGQDLWGEGHAFRFFGDKHWAEPLRWARTLPGKLGRRPRVFCASMADVFEERDELHEHRERLFGLILDTPELDWLVLTKRPEFARDWLHAYVYDCDHGGGLYTGHCPACKTIENLWLGVSIENARFTWRADVLRDIPAAVRFISAEPLLGSLFPTYDGGRDVRADRQPALEAHASRARDPRPNAAVGSCSLPADADGSSHVQARAPLDLTGIDWVIAGGESGPGARQMHPDWARELRDACVKQEPCGLCSDDSNDLVHAWGVCGCSCHPPRPAFFFKQWGEWVPYEPDAQPPFWNGQVGDMVDGHYLPAELTERMGEGVGGWRAEPEGDVVYRRIGKKRAGRHLDGRTWDEFPASAAVPA